MEIKKSAKSKQHKLGRRIKEDMSSFVESSWGLSDVMGLSGIITGHINISVGPDHNIGEEWAKEYT